MVKYVLEYRLPGFLQSHGEVIDAELSMLDRLSELVEQGFIVEVRALDAS